MIRQPPRSPPFPYTPLFRSFNVAARLEGSAAAGEILLGENVYRLVRGAVRAQPLEPLALRGRRARVEAWRLLELEPDGAPADRKSTRLNSSHANNSYAVFCL